MKVTSSRKCFWRVIELFEIERKESKKVAVVMVKVDEQVHGTIEGSSNVLKLLDQSHRHTGISTQQQSKTRFVKSYFIL